MIGTVLSGVAGSLLTATDAASMVIVLLSMFIATMATASPRAPSS